MIPPRCHQAFPGGSSWTYFPDDLGTLAEPSSFPSRLGTSPNQPEESPYRGPAVITLRDIAAIRAVAHYHVLSRLQIQQLCYPTDRTGRATRKRLDLLVAMGLLTRTPTPIFNRHGGSPWPAYYPSRKGCRFLASYCDDEH